MILLKRSIRAGGIFLAVLWMLSFASAQAILTATLSRPTDNGTVGGLAQVVFTVSGVDTTNDETVSWKIVADKGLPTEKTMPNGTGSSMVTNKSVFIDTTSLSNGVHTITIVATGSIQGEVTSASSSVTVNNTDFVILTTPENNDVITGDFQITGKVGGTWSLRLGSTGAPFASGVPPPTALDYTWQTGNSTTPLVPDGQYSLQLVVKDTDDNESVAERQVKVDHTAPTIEFKKPEKVDPADSVIYVKGSSVPVQAEITEDNLDKWIIKIDGFSTVGLSPKEGTGTEVNLNWDTRTYSQTTHTIDITATDKAKSVANSTTETLTVVVDNDAPYAVITEPLVNKVIKGDASVNIVGSVLEPNLREWRLTVDGGTSGLAQVRGDSTGTTTPVTTTWDPSTLTDGSHTITLTGEDKAGNIRSADRSITIDKTAPRITITKPETGTETRGVVTITATIEDTNADKWDVYLDNDVLKRTGLSQDKGTGTSINITWNSASYSQGDHTIYIKATDKAEWETIETVVVNIDNIPPVVSITSPDANKVFPGTSDIDILGTASDANMKEWRVTVDDALIGSGTTSVSPASVLATWDPTAFSDGSHTIKVTAEDNAGGKTEVTRTLILDKSAPTVTFTNPGENSATPTVKGQFAIRATITDASKVRWKLQVLQGSTVVKEWIDLNDVKNVSQDWFTSQKDDSGNPLFTDGSYTLKITVWDEYGDEDDGPKNEKTVSINIDNTIPVLELTEPEDKSMISGVNGVYRVNIKGTVTDTSDTNWRAVVDGTEIATGFGSVVNAVWDATTAFSGNHTVTVTATDKAGNSVERTLTLRRDKDKPTANIVFPYRNMVLRAGTTVTVTLDITDQFFDSVNTDLNTVDADGVEVKILDLSKRLIMRVNTGARLDVRSETQARWTATFVARTPLTFLPNKKYTMEVRVTDKSGNVSIPVTINFSVKYR